jgi:hypothetical protein
MRRGGRHADTVSADRMIHVVLLSLMVEEGCLCDETGFARALSRTDVLWSHRLEHWIRTHRPFAPRHKFSSGVRDFNLTAEWTSCELREKVLWHSVLAPENPSRETEVEHLVTLIVSDVFAQTRRADGDLG